MLVHVLVLVPGSFHYFFLFFLARRAAFGAVEEGEAYQGLLPRGGSLLR